MLMRRRDDLTHASLQARPALVNVRSDASRVLRGRGCSIFMHGASRFLAFSGSYSSPKRPDGDRMSLRCRRAPARERLLQMATSYILPLTLPGSSRLLVLCQVHATYIGNDPHITVSPLRVTCLLTLGRDGARWRGARACRYILRKSLTGQYPSYSRSLSFL